MGILTAKALPLAATATTFTVPPGAAIAAGSGVYGTATTAGASRWVLGSSLKTGRHLMVVLNTGAIASSPTAIKVSLWGSGTTSSGANGAEIAATVNETLTPAANTVYVFDIDLNAVSDLTKYYSLAITVNGASASSTVYASAHAQVLDPDFTP